MPDPDLRRALGYILPYWRRLSLVLVLSLLGTALSLYLPYLSKELVDNALVGGDATALIRIVSLFALITLLSFAINVLSGLRYTRVSAEILFDMRLALYRHLQRLSPRFYARMPLGQIVSRINADIGEIQRVLAEAALGWITNLLLLVGTTVMLIWLDVRLFLASVALVPPAMWALVIYRRRLDGAVTTMRERSATIGSFLIETLQGMKLVVASNAQDREVGSFRMKNDAFIEALMAMRRLTYLSGGLPGLLVSGSSGVVFLYGGWRVIDGAITLGTLVAFAAYQMRLISPIQGLMGLYANLATARVSLRRVHEILDTAVEVVERENAEPLSGVIGELTLHDVTFSFDRGGPVLDGVRLTVQAGETVAIVGPSGGGKSTIADLLVRQLDPDEGHILLDGRDITAFTLTSLREHVVCVEQEPFVFNASIAENVRYARPEATDAEVVVATRAAGLEEFVERLPERYATQVGEGGRALSAGERQRVAIARAFLVDPAVLVLDEPTAALDAVSEAQVIEGYEAIMRGRTTIVISHRFKLARKADRVIVLDQGRVVEEGPPEELLARRGAFYRLAAVE